MDYDPEKRKKKLDDCDVPEEDYFTHASKNPHNCSDLGTTNRIQETVLGQFGPDVECERGVTVK